MTKPKYQKMTSLFGVRTRVRGEQTGESLMPPKRFERSSEQD
jgi:hypothetical protein